MLMKKMKEKLIILFNFSMKEMKIFVNILNGQTFETKSLTFQLHCLLLIYLLMFCWKLLIGCRFTSLFLIKRKLI